MAQQTELKLNQYYYPRTEANTTFACKDHPHDYAENSYSMLLLLGNDGTTKGFTKNIKQDVTLYASVKNKGNIVQDGSVDFIANGIHYPKPVKYQNGGYFAALTITWTQVANYRVTATYRTDNSNYSLCADHCMITVPSPYILSAPDANIQTGGQYSVTVQDANTQGKLKDVQVVLKVNGRLYEKTTDANGVASLSINLPAGTYSIVTSCFYGTQEVNQETKKLTVTSVT